MAWGKVDDQLAFHPKVLMAGNEAMGVWIRALSYSCQMLTDGFVPEEIIDAFGGRAAAERLVVCGLWVRLEAGYLFHDWEHYQPSATAVRERRESVREARRAAGVASGIARQQNANKTRTKREQNTNPVPVPVPNKTIMPTNEVRGDVQRLCDALRAGMVANGLREPTVTAGWLREARLLFDKDNVSLDDALRVLAWSQNDSFWKSNILSIPTFRKQFDRLLLASQRETLPPSEVRRVRELEESKLKREKELARSDELRREMAEQAQRAVPAPRCRHDKILVVCDICVQEMVHADESL